MLGADAVSDRMAGAIAGSSLAAASPRPTWVARDPDQLPRRRRSSRRRCSRELARSGPVDVVTTPAAAAVLANHPAVRDGHRLRQARRARGIAGLWRLAQTLRVATAHGGTTDRSRKTRGGQCDACRVSRAGLDPERDARAPRRVPRASRVRDIGRRAPCTRDACRIAPTGTTPSGSGSSAHAGA